MEFLGFISVDELCSPPLFQRYQKKNNQLLKTENDGSGMFFSSDFRLNCGIDLSLDE